MLVEEHLPDIDGISFNEIIRRDYPTTQVIIVSQDKHYDTVLRALRNGASDSSPTMSDWRVPRAIPRRRAGSDREDQVPPLTIPELNA
jgi:DNA-binding NarL/FixJ family response regulator